MAEAEAAAASATDASAAEKTEAATLLTDKPGEQKPADKPVEEAKTKAGEAPATEKKEGETQTDKKDEKPAEIPEKYDLKLPEGTLINDELMSEFTALGKEQKWDNATAQKMADLHLKSVSTFANQQIQAFQEKVEGWKQSLLADPELKGNVEIDGKQVTQVDAYLDDARKTMKAFCSPQELPALMAEFNNTGLGNYSPLIKLLARAAKGVGDDRMAHGTPKPASEKSAAEIMYGGDKK